MSKTRAEKFDKFLSCSALFCAGVIFQMIFNLSNRPWIDDGKFYRGDIVVHAPEDDGKFYTMCNKGEVLYVDYKADRIAVRWSGCEGHENGLIFDFHNANQLQQKYLK